MADTAVSTVVNKLAELATNEAAFLIKVHKEMRVLRDKLEWIQAFLKDADQKRRANNNQCVAVWVRQTRNLAFDLEDTLDEFFRKAEKWRLASSGWKAILQLRWMTDLFTHVWVAHKLSIKIDVIKERLSELRTNMEDYKIEIVPVTSPWTSSFRKNFFTWDHNSEKQAVGMDDKIEGLTNLLLEGTKKRKVISIIGETGVGKALLAKKVYDSREIKKHFEILVWKSLASKFRPSDLFYDIYCEVLPQLKQDPDEEGCQQEDFGKSLESLLNERQYLVVLDGIISLADWKHISAFLPNKKKGSRILLIPRPESEIARLGNPEVTQFPADILFTKNESMQLFDLRFAKNNRGLQFGPFIRDIHNVTEGHPLTIVLLAGLLRTKDSLSEWEKVFNHLKANKGTKPIDSMLSLCFDDLPHQLKSCFLYFAIVPESTCFRAERLVRLWVAEGFVQPKQGKTLEEIGEGYLQDLISRSLIQVQEKDEYGGVEVVAVDDLVHAFVQSEANESSFVEIHDNADIMSSRTIRRLLLQNNTQKHVKVENSFPKIRSFMCDCVEENEKYSLPHKMKFLLESKFIRVIDLRGLIIKRLPNGFGNIIHLRYLAIQCFSLKKLPSSIGKLLNLQTLDIRKTSIKKLPRSFWRIPALRHILADSVELPRFISNLNNLQTLKSVDCTKWEKKDGLLEKMNVRSWKEKEGLLQKMMNIRSLELKELSITHAEVISSSLRNLGFLKHLRLEAKKDHTLPSNIFTISSLRCLQSMELRGRLDNPQGPESDVEPKSDAGIQYNFPNLINLSLELSEMRQRFVNALSKFPSLSNLYLFKAYDGKKLVFIAGGFQKLKQLELVNLPGLEECKIITSIKEQKSRSIVFKKSAMPSLTKLTIWGCAELKSLPDGLQEKQELEEVNIFEMPDIVKEIEKRVGKNYEKIQHAHIIKTRL